MIQPVTDRNTLRGVLALELNLLMAEFLDADKAGSLAWSA